MQVNLITLGPVPSLQKIDCKSRAIEIDFFLKYFVNYVRKFDNTGPCQSLKLKFDLQRNDYDGPKSIFYLISCEISLG